MDYIKISEYKKIKKQADTFYKNLLERRLKIESLKKHIAICDDVLERNWRDEETFKDKIKSEEELERIESSMYEFYENWHKTELYNDYGFVYCTILEDVERAVC